MKMFALTVALLASLAPSLAIACDYQPCTTCYTTCDQYRCVTQC